MKLQRIWTSLLRVRSLVLYKELPGAKGSILLGLRLAPKDVRHKIVVPV